MRTVSSVLFSYFTITRTSKIHWLDMMRNGINDNIIIINMMTIQLVCKQHDTSNLYSCMLLFFYHYKRLTFGSLVISVWSDSYLMYIVRELVHAYANHIHLWLDLWKGVLHKHPNNWVWRTVSWYSSKMKVWNFHHIFLYVSVLGCANFKFIYMFTIMNCWSW